MSTTSTNPRSTSEMLSVAQAAEILGIGRTMAYALIRGNAWPTPVVRIGRLIKIPAAPLRQLAATGSAHHPDAA